jgi:hypothetical protein
MQNVALEMNLSETAFLVAQIDTAAMPTSSIPLHCRLQRFRFFLNHLENQTFFLLKNAENIYEIRFSANSHN